MLDEKAEDFLVEKGFDPQYGARPMRRSVEKNLEDPLAEELLRGAADPDAPGGLILVEGSVPGFAGGYVRVRDAVKLRY